MKCGVSGLLIFLFIQVGYAIEPIFPRALTSGDTIMFVAPAGPLDQARMELAKQRLEAMGLTVRVPQDLYRQDGFLAGDDDRRAEELNGAFADPEVAAIFPGTGGYGCTRILDRIDYETIARNPKIIVGFSDLTALHIAISQRTGLVTFHSPNPMWGLGNQGNLSPLSAHWFWRAILRKRYEGANQVGYLISATDWQKGFDDRELERSCNLDPPQAMVGGIGRGRLIGGNLALIAAMMGTPDEIQTSDRILFLEDIGEAPYRIDRMLCTMRLGGKLDDLAGVVLGQFTRRKSEDTTKETTSIDDVLDEYFGSLHIPVIKNFPLGHHKCNTTLPIGALCELDADQQTLRLLENPVSGVPLPLPTAPSD